MDINELELWWASLPVTRKEEIAKKGLTKGFANHSFDEAEVRYPANPLLPKGKSGFMPTAPIATAMSAQSGLMPILTETDKD